MIRAALRGLLGRKLRTILTAVAIVLGVAMVSGTFVLTDSIDKAFNSIFTDVAQGLRRGDHRARPRRAPTTARIAPTLPTSLLAKVQALPDVAAAEGSVGGDGAPDRHERQGDRRSAVAPNLGFSIAERRIRASTR